MHISSSEIGGPWSHKGVSINSRDHSLREKGGRRGVSKPLKRMKGDIARWERSDLGYHFGLVWFCSSLGDIKQLFVESNKDWQKKQRWLLWKLLMAMLSFQDDRLLHQRSSWAEDPAAGACKCLLHKSFICAYIKGYFVAKARKRCMFACTVAAPSNKTLGIYPLQKKKKVLIISMPL